jgi:hypothetical protein
MLRCAVRLGCQASWQLRGRISIAGPLTPRVLIRRPYNVRFSCFKFYSIDHLKPNWSDIMQAESYVRSECPLNFFYKLIQTVFLHVHIICRLWRLHQNHNLYQTLLLSRFTTRKGLHSRINTSNLPQNSLYSHRDHIDPVNPPSIQRHCQH